MIEQTKTKPQETLEFKMNKQMKTFSFNPPIKLVGEDKLLLAVSSFECKNFVFNITNEENFFLSLYQVIGKPNLMKLLLSNYIKYLSLGLLNYKHKKLEKEGIKK